MTIYIYIYIYIYKHLQIDGFVVSQILSVATLRDVSSRDRNPVDLLSWIFYPRAIVILIFSEGMFGIFIKNML